MVSTAPDDNLANISDYLYSIAPSNNDQAMAMLRYAQALDAKKVALFVDVCDGYSKDLATGILKAFGSSIAITLVPYRVGEPETLQAGLKVVLKVQPNLIVFAGRASDVNVLLNDTNMPITRPLLGGSALYEVGEYNGNAGTRFQLLRFTSPAYPDEWSVLGHQQQIPAFFTEYPQVFDPDGVHSI